MGERKPSMFIGSSSEGKRIAETVQLVLDEEIDCTVWNQGVFGLSGGTLESLVAAVDDYDFATLVLTPDDLLEKRDQKGRSPRDNVLFELGLFMGALGRDRTFIVHSRTTPPMLPSDLAGITPATYEERSNLEAALGPACTRIKRAIESKGTRHPLLDGAEKDSQISEFKEILNRQNIMLTELFRRLTSDADQSAMAAVPNNMDFLEGAWVSTPPGSHAYCRVEHGVPRIVYCYNGNFKATGEYYDLRRIGDEILGRFRWLDESFQGFVWLKIENPTQLSGAWWYEDNVPEKAYDNPDRLKQSRGMNSYTWQKLPPAKFPDWALHALRSL
jgi:predicted nucleotide-binding protein with TIR-like domain